MGSKADTLILLGTNHRKSPIAFREKVAFLPDEHPEFLKTAHETLQGSDCFLISTCNRTEFYTVGSNGSFPAVFPAIWELLARYKAVDRERDAGHFYEFHGAEAVRQLFRVATGIDSLMLGEPQILEQVKDAYDLSVRQNVAGVIGERMLTAAIRCGKRARSETTISRGAISVAKAAVSLSYKVFANLTPRTALVIGAGETGAQVARNLRQHSIGKLYIANRTLERGRDLAVDVRGEPLSMEDIPNVLEQVDIVIGTAATSEPIVSESMLHEAVRHRKGTMLVVDIGVPRNIHPDVAKIDNVFLNDVDSLQGMIQQNILRRQQEVPKVERIIKEELTRFLDWHSGLQAGPIIKELHIRMEELRLAEIKRQKGLTPEQLEAVNQATHGLMNKILHTPTSVLRQTMNQGETGLRKIQLIRELFGLDSKRKPE